MKTRLVIVRHGETEYNLKGLFQGQLDARLTKKGERQAACTAKRLQAIEYGAIYASPLQRAVKTADIINRGRGLKMNTDSRLKEIRCGRWEGLQIGELMTIDPEGFHLWEYEPHQFAIEGGESFAQVSERVTEALEHIIADNRGKTVVIVSHMVAILLMLLYFTGGGIADIWKMGKQPNAAISIIDIDADGKADIIVRGDNSHLGDDEISIPEWEPPSLDSSAANFA